MRNPFRYFNSSPDVIRLTAMLYIRYPLSLRQVEDLLFEHGIDICHETVRLWWNRFGPMFAAEIRRRRAQRLRAVPQWRWHLDEVFVKINGELHYLWRAALRQPLALVTDRLRSYRAAMKEIGIQRRQISGRWLNNRAENSISRSDDEKERWRGSETSRPCRNSPPHTLQSIFTSSTTAI